MSRLTNKIAGFLRGESRSTLPGWADPARTGGPIVSGQVVNEKTALGISAVWQAVTLISNSVASVPAFVVERIDDQDRWGTARNAREHPANPLLATRPNEVQTTFKFKQTLMIHALTGGNGYAEIEWADRGRWIPRALHLIDPRTVDPVMGDDGKLRYKIDNDRDELPARDVVHVAGLSRDGIRGISPVSNFRQTLGLASSQEAYQSGLMENTATPNGYLQIDRVLNPSQKQAIRNDHEELHRGKGNAGRMGVLDGGMRWVQTSFSPEDAQLLNSRAFSVAEVARIFNVPGHMLGLTAKATAANLEQTNLHFLIYTLTPWLTALEQELAKLIHPAERGRYSVDHDPTQYLRADLATRVGYAKGLFGLGALSRNEVRSEFNLPPVEGGDGYYIAANNLSPIGSQEGDGPKLDPDGPKVPDGSTEGIGRRSAPIGRPSVVRRGSP